MPLCTDGPVILVIFLPSAGYLEMYCILGEAGGSGRMVMTQVSQMGPEPGHCGSLSGGPENCTESPAPVCLLEKWLWCLSTLT